MASRSQPVSAGNAQPSAAQRERYRQHLIATIGLEVTGHPHGYCIRFGGEVVDVFPTLSDVAAGLVPARNARRMLAECLGRRSKP